MTESAFFQPIRRSELEQNTPFFSRVTRAFSISNPGFNSVTAALFLTKITPSEIKINESVEGITIWPPREVIAKHFFPFERTKYYDPGPASVADLIGFVRAESNG